MVETYGAHECRAYYVEETAYGQTPADPAMLGVPAESIDPSIDPSNIKVRGVGSIDLQSVKRGLRAISLKIAYPLPSEAPINFLQNAKAELNKSLSVQVLYYKGIFASATDIISFLYTGCKFHKLTVECSIEDIAKATAELIGQDLTVGTSKIAGATYADYAGAVPFYESYVKKGTSTVIDYGATPLLPSDKIHVTLPNENVDSDFRIESVEYRVDAKTQTLEITLELGKVPPKLADYLYGLRTFTVNVEKLSRTKLGKKGIPSVTQSGSVGSHHVAHEAGDDNGDLWPSADAGGWDKITGWIAPRFLGPFADEVAMVQFRTKDKAGSTVRDHQFVPTDNEHGLLGSETQRWKEVHSYAFFLPGTGYVRCRLPGENALMQLSKDALEFGAGGAAAPDVHLKRIAEETFELKAAVLKPAGDNVTELGSSDKRFKKLWLVDLTLTSDLNIDKQAPVVNLKTSGAIKATFGFDGVNAFLSAQAGDLVLSAASGVVRPYADATYDLGNGSFRWSGLYVAGVGSLGWLNIGGFTVITSGRVLQNVTADTAIIASGRFAAARLPEGSSGYVLEAQGAGFDPMYVNPHGRYLPAGHEHAAGDITSGTIAEARLPNAYTGLITFQGGIVTNSVNCANWQLADAVFANGFRMTETDKLGFGRGIAFLDEEGRVLMILSKNGDLHLAGRVRTGLCFKKVRNDD